jgi:hypothetical protein
MFGGGVFERRRLVCLARLFRPFDHCLDRGLLGQTSVTLIYKMAKMHATLKLGNASQKRLCENDCSGDAI